MKQTRQLREEVRREETKSKEDKKEEFETTFWHTKTHINCCTLTSMQTTNLSIDVMQSCRVVNDGSFVASDDDDGAAAAAHNGIK